MKKLIFVLCCWLTVLGMSAATYPDKLYLIGDVCGWQPGNAIAPDEAASGVYTWNSIKLPNATNSSYSYFTFTTVKDSSWDDVVNKSDRYGANSYNEMLTKEATIAKFNGGGNASSANSWQVSGGTYKVVADLVNMKVRITSTGEEQEVVVPTEPVTIYWDNSTAKWVTPHIHYWGTSGSTWPGEEMTFVSGTTWTYVCPAGTTGCSFNAGDGDATKTGDFTATDGHIYNQSGDKGAYTPVDPDDPDPVIPDDPDPVLPTGKYYVYFDATGSTWSAPHVWAWNSQDLAKATKFPGDAMTKIEGNLWYYELPYPDKGMPTGLIISSDSGGNTNTGNLTFVNGATYKSNGSFVKPDFEPTGTLPVLYINVYKDAEKTQLENEIIDKDLAHKNYFKNAEYWLEANGCDWIKGAVDIGSKDDRLPLQIKARGNYTRKGFSKKPYKLKLGKGQNLLGMTPEKSKHYALITHADDPYGYMRNFVGFRLGQMIGLPWTPNQQPVEVVINGNYRGIYFLTESIRVGDGRVPITELADNADNPTDISGGYLVELDNYDDDCAFSLDDPTDRKGTKLYVTPDTPELYSDQQLRFVKEQFTTMNNLIAANNGTTLWSYLDQDDAARYYVVEEILGHYEAYHGSTYLYREKGEGQKWHFSPLWDCGHAFDGPAENFFSESDKSYGNNWVGSYSTNKGLRFNDSFMSKVKTTFQWFVNKETEGSASPYEKLLGEIDDYVAHIKAAAMLDAQRWAGEAKPTQVGLDVPADVVNNSDIESHDKAAVKDYLNKKITWLKSKWGSQVLPEPERDTTPAAELPAYVQEGYVAPTYDVYLIDDANTPWGAPMNAYVYDDKGNDNGTFPGQAMTYDETVIIDGHTGAYHFVVKEGFLDGYIIFKGKNDRYPGDGAAGLKIADKMVFHTNGKTWREATSIEYVKDWSYTLPLVKIYNTTENPIGYGDDGKVSCTFAIDALGIEGYSNLATTTASIKGRGKDWEEGAKNSYKLKFDSKVAPLGMIKSKHWVLMPYRYDSDNGLLTNYAGHELSRLIGLKWTPSMQPVELVIDDEYQGLYFLAENVRAASNRVAIADYGDPGYSEEHDFLLEIDQDHLTVEDLYLSELACYWNTNACITSTPSLEDIKKDADAEAIENRIYGYLLDHINALDKSVAAAGTDNYSLDWADLIDYEEAAKFYVVQEIMDDARAFTNNFYIYHTTVSTDDGGTAGSKWFFGPVWDFSGAFAQEGHKESLIHSADEYKGTFIKDLYNNNHFLWFVYATYYKFVKGERMPSDPSQLAKVSAMRKAEAETETETEAPKPNIFNTYDPTMAGKFEDVLTSIDGMAARISEATEADAKRWSENAATSADNTLEARADELKAKLRTNVYYLGTPTAEGGAGWGQSDVITGIEDITLGADDANAIPQYFDLTGRRIACPQPGQMIIELRGSRATKRLAR